MEFTGKIIDVLEPREGTNKSNGNTWKVQEYVIESNVPGEQYPSRMCFEVFGEDRINQLAIKGGQELTVSFDINCRDWNDPKTGKKRWFNSLRAWKVAPVASVSQNIPSTPFDEPMAEGPSENQPAQTAANASAEDDLPF